MRLFRLASLIAFATACASAYASCSSAKAVRPFDDAQQRFRLMLAQGQYDKLERWARKSEDPAERISDGQSLHAAFMAGLGLASRCSDSMDAERILAAEGYRSRLAEWAARYPESRSAKLANALYPLSYAWAVRGAGYASEVDKKAWPIFEENVAKARKAMEALPADVRRDPAWYAAMLDILNLQSAPEKEYDSLLNEAVARYPDYEYIWFEAGSYYAPKWGGDPRKVRAMAERAADATRARLGETMYARVQWSSWDDAMFRNGQADWPRMKQGFERMIKDYPDNWNANHFGKFACMAHDPEGLHEAFAHVTRPLLEAWDTESWYETCKSHANDPVKPISLSR